MKNDYLSKTLQQIEAQGYDWSLKKRLTRPQYRVILYPEGLTFGGSGSSIFAADTPEEAAASALIWILGQEASQ